METKRAKLVKDEMCEIDQNNFTTIEALSKEILINILQFLSPVERIRSEQVCKKWKDASRQTWRDVQTLHIIDSDSAFYQQFADDDDESYELVEKEGNQLLIRSDSRKIIHCLVSRVGCFINKLTLDYLDSENAGAIIPIITFYCRNLRVLFVGDNNEFTVDETLLSMLFEYNQELHSVRCDVQKNVIEALPFRDWRSLRLYQFADECNEEKIVSLIENSENLEEFGNNQYTTCIVDALLKLRNLKSLYFRAGSEGPSLKTILHASLLNRLESLVIESNAVFLCDSEVFCNVLQHCCQLKRLRIDCLLGEFPLKQLLKILNLPNLETLELRIHGMYDDMLLNFMPIRNLLLVDTQQSVTNEGILRMITDSEFFGKLENLDIKFTLVTPELFIYLVSEMRNRQKYLNVRPPRKIFDEVSEICAGSKIRVVKDMPCFDYCIL